MTVNVLACFEGGKQAFFSKLHNMEKEILNKRIYDLWREGKISGRVHNVLQSLKIEDVESLVRMTRFDLLNGRFCGRKAVNEIEECLEGYGLSLNMSEDTINEIKGVAPLSNDTDMTAAYWKRLFVDLSLTLMMRMNDGDDKTRCVYARDAIASAKNIVIQLKKDIDTIDKWINE